MRWVILCLWPSLSCADALVATRVIVAGSLVDPDAVTVVDIDIAGALTTADDAIGLETLSTIYPGRPIRAEDLGKGAQVARNQVVTLVYLSGALRIQAEGRALQSGRAEDVIPVLNLGSRNRVSGRIMPDGSVHVFKSGS